MKLTEIQLQPFLMATFLSLALVAGCEKNSSTDSDSSTAKCGHGASCQGSYSASSSDSKVWTGPCEVSQVDSGEWTKLWFVRPMVNCGFEWVRAQGSVGSDWATLASGTATEFMVEHTGENVFQLRRCESGGNKTNDGCL
jgi:hypothetical protein